MTIDDLGLAPGEWDDWLFPNCPSSSLDEIERQFPNALTWFDWMCPHFAGKPMRFVTTGGTRTRVLLRVSTPRADWPSGTGTAVWLPEVQLWRRYTRGVASFPRREPQLLSDETSSTQRVLVLIDAGAVLGAQDMAIYERALRRAGLLVNGLRGLAAAYGATLLGEAD